MSTALAPAFLQRRAEREARVTEEGFWYRLSQFVRRRPIGIATATAALLLVLSIPFYSMKFTSVDAQVLPESASARQVDDVLRSEFPPFRDSPVRVLVEDPAPGAVAAVQKQLRSVDGIVQVNPPQRLENGDVVVQAINDHPFIDPESRDARRAGEGPPRPGRRRLSWSPAPPPASSTSSRASPTTCRSPRRSSCSRR